MSPVLLGALAFGGMFLLIALHAPLGAAMGLIGVAAYTAVAGFAPAVSLIGTEAATALSNKALAVIPMFLLLGSFASRAGMSADLYRLAAALCGRWRGGLAYATLLACIGFGAISGSSVATAATMTTVALPEMRRRGYGAALSTGSVAAGGTLGLMVPPSIMLVLYAAFTEQFVVTLYAASIVPALIALALMLLAVAVTVRIDPKAGPAADRADRRELLAAAWGAVPALMLALIMFGGLATGVFTVDEAAAVGMVLAFVVAAWRRKLGRAGLQDVLAGAAATTGMIYLMLIGANVLSYFVTVTELPTAMIDAIGHLSLPHWGVLALLLSLFVVLGAIFDEVTVMLLTLPFSLPLVVSMGYTPVWWGVVNVVVIVIGMIAPPIGLNVFVVKSMTPEVPMKTIYAGVMPFVVAQAIVLALLVASPALAAWLPLFLGLK